MRDFIQRIIWFFKYKYDHTQCVIKQYSIHACKSSTPVSFKGRNPFLTVGKYSVSCQTPYGYKIKYIRLPKPTHLNIKKFILK